MIDENALNIYTDGSCRSGPRRGGVGILYVWIDSSGNEETDTLPQLGFPGATNNEMELKAPIYALKNSGAYMDKGHFSRILIHTDSQYVVNNYRNAMFTWPKKRWRTMSGSPVANAHLWKDLVKAMKKTRKRVDFVWVKGHSGNK